MKLVHLFMVLDCVCFSLGLSRSWVEVLYFIGCSVLRFVTVCCEFVDVKGVWEGYNIIISYFGLFYGWSLLVNPFSVRCEQLKNSIALKAGATASEVEAYLNFGQKPISRGLELRFQNSFNKFSLEEREFISFYHTFPKSVSSPLEALSPHLKPSSSGKSKEKKPLLRKSRSSRVVGKTVDSDLGFIAALTKHHMYENGVCENFEPIKCIELSEITRMAKSTVSRFFKKEFQGYKNYQISCKNGKISQSLKLLNKDVQPFLLLGKGVAEIGVRSAPDKDL